MRYLVVGLRSIAPFIIGLPILIGIEAITSRSYTLILITIGVNIILAVSLNVINGYTGQFSLGHAGFMAVGAYTSAKFLLTVQSIPFVPEAFASIALFGVSLLFAMTTAAIAGFVVGMPSLRLRGDYLAIVTLGFGEIIRSLLENMESLGGATGLSGIPNHTNLIWVGMAVIATVLMAQRIGLSTEGRALIAIREDEIAAEAMGINTTSYKVQAFVLSAAYAGLAGALLSNAIHLATPKMFTFVKSIEVVAMVVLGGLGSITGAIFAAAFLTMLLELLREVNAYRMVVYSILLIALMLLRPQGIFGVKEFWHLKMFRWLWRRHPKELGDEIDDVDPPFSAPRPDRRPPS